LPEEASEFGNPIGKNSMPLLSLRAYAKHRGVSLAAVQKAIHSGRITPNADGLIDSGRADAEWDAKTRPGQRRAPAAAAAPKQPAEAPAAGLDYFRARAIRESYLARLAKIEFEERTAKLVSRDEVQVAAFTNGRTIRDNLLNIPDRLAATLAAETDADRVHHLLSAEIRKALEELSGAHSR
jgi:pyruvate/2-oxoglutarate dehydrogenase complex dihydrolipoamide acyltransferase (E2) component